jgi:hypothetical protein
LMRFGGWTFGLLPHRVGRWRLEFEGR